MPRYPDTFYARTVATRRDRPPPRGQVEVEICIVGGGLAGLTCAYELARAGRSVAILEAEAVGWGASGRNGGFVGAGYSRGHASIARAVGEDEARALHRLSIEGMHIVSDMIRDLDVAASVSPLPGKIAAVRYDSGDRLQRTRERLARDYGYEVDFWPREQVREILRTPSYHQALFDPNSFHIHPLNYARAIAEAIEAAGGLIYEDARVVSAELSGAQKRLVTAGGSVSAQHVVIACGGYTDNLVPKLRSSHLPIATYVLTTEAAPEALAEVIRTRAAVSDDRRAGDYYRLVEDGARLLWGGRITTRTSEPHNLAAMLRQTMISTYPQLAGLKVEMAWSGLMSYARHLMPQIGRLGPGVWHCMGFGGHGLNTTAIGGRVVAEGILDATDRHRHFAPFGLVWNGGPFGTAAVQATYWSYQLADWWRERKTA
ncbi:NAD(P)/FAD-dependent oxidoreductase [Bosea sp. (in: a-proteobacteria)]|jgi:gamma-glutamylputrescine oxidase|uniref:NAD(P)/FAD-dependent oxidoreductase n=1 Tax=Bosea sp. (in: a-proteobacteria) TaxID=1871050 RepID=UPI003F700543